MFSLTQITMSIKIVIFISLFTQTWSLENEEINWLVKFKKIFKEDALTIFAQEYGKRSDLNNSSCSTDLQTWKSSLQDKDTRTWALQMLDSGGRIPYGLLKGNFNSLGQYGECVAINHTPSGTDRNIIGKRCLIRVPMPEFDLEDISQNKMIKTLLQRRDPIEDSQVHTRALNVDYVNGGFLYNVAICIPASCPAADLESTLNDKLMSLNITLANITVPEVFCYTDTFVPYSSAEIGGISFFSVWAFIMLLSTLYDVWFEFYRKDVTATKNLLYSSFSVYTNSKRLITLSKEPGPLGCLHGMRSISIIWIITAHGYTTSVNTPLENLVDFWKWLISYVGMTITASTISVDTFFLMSGLLLSYVFFKKMSRHDSFAKTLPTFYLHRYLRLTPVQGAVILFSATLLSRTLHTPDGVGPSCERNWWVNLLYVQNYVRPEEMCVGQTWYLAVDMQLYILSPIVLYPLLKKPKIGVALALFWILAAQATVYAISRVNGWWGAMIPLKDGNRDNYQKSYYFPTHMRATPWLIGVLAGYLMRKVGKNTKPFELSDRGNLLKCMLIILGWLAALAIMAAVLFGMHPLQENTHKFSYWEDTVYLTFHRTAWSFAVLYIIVACAYGYGGPINWFLSLRMWEFFGRLSYSIYLNHMMIQLFFASYSVTSVSVFSNARMIYQCMGDVLCSAVLAYFMVLAFESPITVLEKIIFKSDRPKRKENTDTQLDPETLDISSKSD